MSARSNTTQEASFALSLHRFLIRLATISVSAFLWVILFMYFAQLGNNFIGALLRTILLYALVQTVTIVVAPVALRIIDGNMLRGLIFGTIFCAAAFIYAGALVADVFPHGAAIVGILLGLYATFYRTPYEIEHRALPSGGPVFGIEVLLASTPFIVGLAACGTLFYPSVLLLAGLVCIAALVPLFFVTNVHETFSWHYRETFAHFLNQKNQSLVVSAALAGAGGALLFLVWPLTLFFSLAPNPMVLGAAFSGALLLVLVLRSRHAHVLMHQRADSATYVDEYTVLKEMSLAAGRLTISLAAAITIAFLI